MINEKSANSEKGACACGDVEFVMLQSPMFVHCCHCTWCQTETGSAFAVNALIETMNVKLEKGKTSNIRVASNSGKGQVIVRCSACCSPIWSHYAAAEEKVAFVRVGALLNSRLVRPDIHIYTSSKVKWLNLDDDVPVVEEYYRRSEYWPEESIKRYKDAIQS